MRGLALAVVVTFALLIALPAPARTIRTDLNRCDEPGSFATVCWDGLPSGAVPSLPINGETAFTNTDGAASAQFSTSSFTLIAFDYTQFVLDNQAFFQANTIADPFAVVSHGLSRPGSAVDPVNGTDWLVTDNPLLRINWFFDIALLPTFGNLFEDVVTVNNVDYFGVQLIFDGQGFELNGLKSAGMAYSRSLAANGPEIWNGAEQPCDTFTNAAVCANAAPEPASIALLGPALLAFIAGLRIRRRLTSRLS